MRVFKYEVIPLELVSISMPIGAKILSIGAQGSSVVLWALVDERLKEETRIFYGAPTGSDLPEDARVFLGTAQVTYGSELAGLGLVFHVFEMTPPKIDGRK